MIPVYVINLKRSQDRLNQFIESCKSSKLQYFYKIDAIDYKYNYPNTPEQCCARSHYLLWCKLFRENVENAIICEDDCVFEDGFVNNVNNIMKTNVDFDIIYLQYRGPSLRSNHNTLWKCGGCEWNNYFTGMVCYLINRSAIKKLMQKQYMIPIDVYMHTIKMNIYVYTPTLARHSDKGMSYIEGYRGMIINKEGVSEKYNPNVLQSNGIWK